MLPSHPRYGLWGLHRTTWPIHGDSHAPYRRTRLAQFRACFATDASCFDQQETTPVSGSGKLRYPETVLARSTRRTGPRICPVRRRSSPACRSSISDLTPNLGDSIDSDFAASSDFRRIHAIDAARGAGQVQLVGWRPSFAAVSAGFCGWLRWAGELG